MPPPNLCVCVGFNGPCHAKQISLPALQKTFVDFFFEFTWEFRIEKWRGFLVNFCGAVPVSGVCLEVLEENSGKAPEKLLGKKFRIAKCCKF